MADPPAERLSAIRARYFAWYNETPEHATWPDMDDDESMENYLVRNDLPDLLVAMGLVLGLHEPCDNDPDRTPICPTCHGKAGAWECGCWADEDRTPVCGTCVEVGAVHNGHGAAPWPCPTVRAVSAAFVV